MSYVRSINTQVCARGKDILAKWWLNGDYKRRLQQGPSTLFKSEQVSRLEEVHSTIHVMNSA